MKVSDIFSKSVISFRKKKRHQPGQQIPLTWHSIEILIGSSSRIIISWLSIYTLPETNSLHLKIGRAPKQGETNPEKNNWGNFGAFGCHPLTAYIRGAVKIIWIL